MSFTFTQLCTTDAEMSDLIPLFIFAVEWSYVEGIGSEFKVMTMPSSSKTRFQLCRGNTKLVLIREILSTQKQNTISGQVPSHLKNWRCHDFKIS